VRQEFFDEKLKNWGEWMRRSESGGLGYGQSPLANLMGKAQRAEYGAVVPIDEVEASRVDDAISTMLPELQLIARCWYVDLLSIRQSAKRVGCSTTTVQVRVEQVCFALAIWWENRKRVAKNFQVDAKKSFDH
jgi:hypothetical protein